MISDSTVSTSSRAISRRPRLRSVLARPGLIALAAAGVCGSQAPTDEAAPPFAVGERLTYQVRLANGNKVGSASMWVEGPVDVRGTSTYLLRFDSRIRYLLVPAVSRSSSWFDPLRSRSLRFSKHEQNPLSHQSESVEMFPDQKRWTSAEGDSGQNVTNAPLDELSFMYFIRTLPMTPGVTYSFDRFFETSRNPTTIKVIRREVIPTPMGELHVIRVEMLVRDPQHYAGEGIIRIHLTDDACRVPARIESKMPVIGTTVLTIDSVTSRCTPQ
jgi:hypothetical protein